MYGWSLHPPYIGCQWVRCTTSPADPVRALAPTLVNCRSSEHGGRFLQRRVQFPSMRFIRLITILSFAATLATPGGAQSRGADRAPWTLPDDSTIRALLIERMQDRGVGAVIGIISPDGQRVVAVGTSGALDARPLDGETVFQIGSVTKVFTGLLLADMSIRREVSLEDPAAKFL